MAKKSCQSYLMSHRTLTFSECGKVSYRVKEPTSTLPKAKPLVFAVLILTVILLFSVGKCVTPHQLRYADARVDLYQWQNQLIFL